MRLHRLEHNNTAVTCHSPYSIPPAHFERQHAPQRQLRMRRTKRSKLQRCVRSAACPRLLPKPQDAPLACGCCRASPMQHTHPVGASECAASHVENTLRCRARSVADFLVFTAAPSRGRAARTFLGKTSSTTSDPPPSSISYGGPGKGPRDDEPICEGINSGAPPVGWARHNLALVGSSEIHAVLPQRRRQQSRRLHAAR